MTRKQTPQHSLLLLLWPPWLLQPPKPLQVSGCNDDVPGSARIQLSAHSMLLCVVHAAVQVRGWRRLAELIIRTIRGARAALSAVEESALVSHTGHMKAAERTTHVCDDSAELLLRLPRPFLASSGPTALSCPRRSGSGAAKRG